MHIGIIGSGHIGSSIGAYPRARGPGPHSRGWTSRRRTWASLARLDFAPPDLGTLAQGGRLTQFPGGPLPALDLVMIDRARARRPAWSSSPRCSSAWSPMTGCWRRGGAEPGA